MLDAHEVQNTPLSISAVAPGQLGNLVVSEEHLQIVDLFRDFRCASA